jgi:hypothetical protein
METNYFCLHHDDFAAADTTFSCRITTPYVYYYLRAYK